MTAPPDILELTLAHFPLPAEALSAVGSFWLTLYLRGDAAQYAAVKPMLEENGWENLSGTDNFAGFSYPKHEVRNEVGQIKEALLTAIAICDAHGMEISMIDADTALDPKESTFRTLYKEA